MTQNKRLSCSVFAVLITLLLNGCATPAPALAPTPADIAQPTATPAPAGPLPTDTPYTVAEAEKLAGFDVKEPTYLPAEVAFNYATYQPPPAPHVILYFKYNGRGAFFQIVQEPSTNTQPNPGACGPAGNECELLQLGDLTVTYHLTPPTESLRWEADGFSFYLLRTAGEPDKLYKEELLKVVASMK